MGFLWISSRELGEIRQALVYLLEEVRIIMATMETLAVELNNVTAQVTKIGSETRLLLQRIADLEAALANSGQTTPEVDAALLALKGQVSVVDELVTDQ